MAADTNIEKHIVHKLNDMRLNGVMCDLELVADDGTCVMVHSTMWIAAFEDTSCLKDMGKDYSLSSKQLDIYGVNGRALKMVVDFIYGNDVAPNDDFSIALEKFGMKNWESFLSSKYKIDSKLISKKPPDIGFCHEHVDANSTVTEKSITPKKQTCGNVTICADRNNTTNTTCVTVKVENEEATEHIQENCSISMSENDKQNKIEQWGKYVSELDANLEIDLSRVKEEPVSPEENLEFLPENNSNNVDSEHETQTTASWNKESESCQKRVNSELGEYSEENYVFRSKTEGNYSVVESSNDQHEFRGVGSQISGKRHHESNCNTNMYQNNSETQLLCTLNKQWSSSRSANRKKKSKHRKLKKHLYSQECSTSKYRTLLPKGVPSIPLIKDLSLHESPTKELPEQSLSVSENTTEIYGSKTSAADSIEMSVSSNDTLKMRDNLEIRTDYLINVVDNIDTADEESFKPKDCMEKSPKPVGLFLNTSNLPKSPKTIVEQSQKESKEDKQGSDNYSKSSPMLLTPSNVITEKNKNALLVEGPNRKSLKTDINHATIGNNSSVYRSLPLSAMPNNGVPLFGNNQGQNTIGNISSGFFTKSVVGAVPYINHMTPAPVFATNAFPIVSESIGTPSQIYSPELGTSIASSTSQVVQNTDRIDVGLNNATNLGPFLVVNGTGNQNTVLQYNYVAPSQPGTLQTVNSQPIPILGNSIQYVLPTSMSNTVNANYLPNAGIQQGMSQVDTRSTAETDNTKAIHVPSTTTMNTKATHVSSTMTKKPSENLISASALEDISKSASLSDGKLKSSDKRKNDISGRPVTLALGETMQGKDCDDPVLVNLSDCDDVPREISVGRKKGCNVEEMCSNGTDIGKRMPLRFQKVDPVTNVAVYEAIIVKDTPNNMDQSDSCPVSRSGDSSDSSIAKEILEMMGNKRKCKNKIVMIGRKDAANRQMAKQSDPFVVRKRGRGRPPKNLSRNTESLQMKDMTKSKLKDDATVKNQFQHKGRLIRHEDSSKTTKTIEKAAALARIQFRPIAPKR